jgi:hypothetical protein
MLAAGHLRPGYMTSGICDFRFRQVGDRPADYFHNPSDTVVTLLGALPHLADDLRMRIEAYIKKEFEAYPPYAITHIGWKDGAPREAFDLPTEEEVDRANYPASNRLTSVFKAWNFAPENFYALAAYATHFGGAKELFEKCRGKLERPRFPASLPYVLNSYVAGYLGYARLAEAAGATDEAAGARRQLAQLLVLRIALAKDAASLAEAGFEFGGHAWTVHRYDPDAGEADYASVRLGGWPIYNFALPYLNLTPELAHALGGLAAAETARAVASYERRNPYWFVAAGEEGAGENVIQPLYDVASTFQAKARILGEGRAELKKYLDVPYFIVGDLFYIQKLVALLEAP